MNIYVCVSKCEFVVLDAVGCQSDGATERRVGQRRGEREERRHSQVLNIVAFIMQLSSGQLWNCVCVCLLAQYLEVTKT